MARIGVTLLAVWAVLATAATAWLLANRSEAPATPAAAPRSGPPSREVEDLREHVRMLEAELRRRHPGPSGRDESDAGVAPTDDARGTMPDEDEIRALIEAYRKTVEAGPDAVWEWEVLMAVERIQLSAEHDARAHLVLLELLGIATDEGDIEDLVDALRDGGARDDAVDAQVLLASRRMLRSDPLPARRAAGAEIFLACAPPGPQAFRFVLDAAVVEPDVATRGGLVAQLGDHGWGLELPPEDVEAFVALLRSQVRAGNTNHVNALAHWSGMRQDLDLALSLLGTVREPDRRRSVLTAFRGGVRLTRGREAEARGVLVRVLMDPGEDRSVRDHALVLLDSHRPWDEAAAEAVRRYREETTGD